MNKCVLEVGDVVRINRFGYWHVGVYVGQRGFRGECVVHNRKGYGVVLSTLAEFSAGTEVFMHQKASGSYFEREQIAQRALSLVGKQ